jgi:hypothetical protein
MMTLLHMAGLENSECGCIRFNDLKIKQATFADSLVCTSFCRIVYACFTFSRSFNFLMAICSGKRCDYIGGNRSI